MTAADAKPSADFATVLTILQWPPCPTAGYAHFDGGSSGSRSGGREVLFMGDGPTRRHSSSSGHNQREGARAVTSDEPLWCPLPRPCKQPVE